MVGKKVKFAQAGKIYLKGVIIEKIEMFVHSEAHGPYGPVTGFMIKDEKGNLHSSVPHFAVVGIV